MLINEAVLRIDQDTTVYLVDIATDEQQPSMLDLTKGAFQSFSRRPRALEVNTPYLNAAVQGTEFVIRAEAGQTSLTVFEGTVAAGNRHGSVAVTQRPFDIRVGGAGAAFVHFGPALGHGAVGPLLSADPRYWGNRRSEAGIGRRS